MNALNAQTKAAFHVQIFARNMRAMMNEPLSVNERTDLFIFLCVQRNSSPHAREAKQA
jgi:hypothetical protein